MMYTLKSIAGITSARFAGNTDHTVQHFLTDSRTLQFAEDSLFIAIRSQRSDAHTYIEDLYQRGVRSFLVHSGYQIPGKFSDASFLLADSPLRVLQELAEHHRQRFSIPVIGITGSNGKTMVKEWLYQCLKTKESICRSPKSYNSQIGVPLSVLNLNSSHTMAIFEAGISRPGEMDILQRIIRPTIGVFTSLGTAHDEGFTDHSEKVREKFRLFCECKEVIANGLPPEFIPGELKARVILVPPLNPDFVIPFEDSASRQNAATCATVLDRLGFSADEIRTGLAKLQPLALRLEMKSAVHNSYIINDFYNSDLDSLKIALNHLRQNSRRKKKVVIVSDIEQSGVPPEQLYRQISLLLENTGTDLVVGIGQEIGRNRRLFTGNALFFGSTQDFIRSYPGLIPQLTDCTILLKGARSFGFEQISRLLQQKSHDTVFEINLTALRENINYYRGLMKGQTRLMCMVKAMGYGSGAADIARTLEHMGVQYLAVAYADEGVELRESQVKVPVMVMNPEEDAFEDIINYQLEPEIYSLRVLKQFSARLDSLGVSEPFPVHIKIDTGMHRLGFELNEIPALIAELKQLPNVLVRSVFSHLAAADNPRYDDFTREQISSFEAASGLLEKELGYSFLKHICNSGGISRFPEAHFDMVRLGIGMYGVGVSSEEQAYLLNVGTLKTRISQIKTVGPGKTVGYNRSGPVSSNTRVATIPIGYADGFSRLLGNGRHGVYIRNKFVRTIGNICMDMSMLDVTAVDCAEGDEVIIFEDHDQLAALAKALNTITYEVLTNVSARVKRVYVQE